MERADLTYGFEAEFLNVDKTGRIRNLTGIVLSPEDEVGVDGHNETVEIRTQPSTSVIEQFYRIESAVRKYDLALLTHGSPAVLTGKRIRGGAYYKTPLSIHLHFGNFENKLIYPMVQLLQHTLYDGFIAHIDSEQERSSRFAGGYGFPDLASCIRVKGDRWWEWRQPSSVFTPACVKVLLGVSEILAQFLHQATGKTVQEVRKRLLAPKKPPLTFNSFLETFDITDVDTEVSPFEIEELLKNVVEVGRIDWKQDLLPCWIKDGEEDKAVNGNVA